MAAAEYGNEWKWGRWALVAVSGACLGSVAWLTAWSSAVTATGLIPAVLALTLVALVALLAVLLQHMHRLRESRHRYRALVDNTSLQICTFGSDMKLTFVNEACCRQSQRTSDELLGRSFLELLPEKDRTAARDHVLHLTAAEHVEEYRYASADGTPSYHRWTYRVNCEHEGHATLYQAIGEDVTARRLAEQAIAENEQKYRLLADNATDVIWTTDLELKFIYQSPSVKRMRGYTADEAVRQSVEQCLTPNSYRVAMSVFEEEMRLLDQGTLPGDGTRTCHLEFTRRDGSTVWAEVSMRFLLDDDRQPVGILGISRDITDRKQAEEQLRNYAAAVESNNRKLEELHRAADEASRAKSEFLANMSHEIRTPMTAILGFADLLLGNVHGDANTLAANTIKRNGEYLLELINDILDLSRIEAGRLEVERIICSPAKVVADVAALMQVQAQAKGLSLDVEYVDEIPATIWCDPTRLRQILINLVGNAVKFTERGSIQLLTRLVNDEADSNQLQFDVVDTGIGMSGDQVANLFQPFTQGDVSTSRKFGGTGLGLSISKRLAEMLGGDITVRSTLGKGSTFSVTVDAGYLDGVPMLDGSAEAAIEFGRRSEISTVLPKQLACHILLAEDGPDNQRLLSFILNRAGAKVTLAENGRIAHDKALAAWEAGEPFDVILMDIHMPVMDGYTATRKLRDADYSGAIVAVSADAMSGIDQRCRQAGCDDYVTKPIDRVALIDTVARHLRQSVSDRA